MKNKKYYSFCNISTSNLAGFFLFIITITVFSPVIHHDFINYDDPIYITENPIIKEGLTLEGLSWALTDTSTASWYPLTWLSHMLDFELFGLNPGGHHFTGLIIHSVNAVLLFFLLKKLTNNLFSSFFVAIIFALHPLHVEPVAWASSRKDLLSAFFWILTMWCYADYSVRGGALRHLLVLICFTLGFMSKAMLVTLPFILLMMDYWPLSRVDFSQTKINIFSSRNPKPPVKTEIPVILKLIAEKIPLFAISLLMILLSYHAQKNYGAVTNFDVLPMVDRISNIIVSYAGYIFKFFLPINLSVHYPIYLPLPLWEIIVSLIILFFISFVSILFFHKRPYLLFGWFWFLGTLVPVIGFIQLGNQAMADRYTYIPIIGLAIIFSWGIQELLENSHKKSLFKLIILAFILFNIILTTLQLRFWQNSVTLFDHAVKLDKNNLKAQSNLGHALAIKGKHAEAIPHFQAALGNYRVKKEIHYNLGKAYQNLEIYDKAIHHYKSSLAIDPAYAKASLNLGTLFYKLKDYDQAVNYYMNVLRANPDHSGAHNNLGIIMLQQNHTERAFYHFNMALNINPDNQMAIKNLQRINTDLLNK
jgi:tetratricopeptide (TPR) repeat protein